jgi:hypothetical protein
LTNRNQTSAGPRLDADPRPITFGKDGLAHDPGERLGLVLTSPPFEKKSTFASVNERRKLVHSALVRRAYPTPKPSEVARPASALFSRFRAIKAMQAPRFQERPRPRRVEDVFMR